MSEAVSRTTVKISSISLARPRLTGVFLALVLITFLCLLFVWSRIHAINLEYDISSLEREIRTQQQQIEKLSLETAYLARDERIEKLAKEHLGLRAPIPGQTIRIE